MIEPTTLSEAVHGSPGVTSLETVGATLSGLPPARLRDAYYYLILARALDERMRALNRQGKASRSAAPWPSSQGKTGCSPTTATWR